MTPTLGSWASVCPCLPTPRIDRLLVRWLPKFHDTLATRWVMAAMPVASVFSSSVPGTIEIDSGTSCTRSIVLRLRVTS